MASSGSVDYSIDAATIIKTAYEDLGVIGEGVSPSANQNTLAMTRLNLIAKQWMGKNDFAPGLKMWSRKRAYLFLDKGQNSYTLGPTTTETGTNNKWSNSYVQTTLSTTAANGASAAVVTATTGIASGYRIGIVLDSGSIFWTTVSGALTGNSVPLTSVTTGAAAAGNVVFCYATTTQGRRPLQILTAVRRSIEGIDSELSSMLLEEYEALSNKIADGTPSAFYYESQLTDGVIYLDMEPVDATDVIRVAYLSPIEDFDSTTDTPDFPQEWFSPLVDELKLRLWPAYPMNDYNILKLQRDESLSIARNANPETTKIYFEPDL